MDSSKKTGADRKEINELIEKVRNGEHKAFSELVEKYSPLIESLVTKFCSEEAERLNRDDLRQEAILKFYNSVLTYDIEQSEVEFGLYSKICISNALISQLRLHKKHTAEQLTEQLSTMFFVHDSEEPSNKILEEERVRSIYTVIKDNLSVFEYNVWQLYMSGRTAREIGVLVGKDEKSVGNAIYRIRKKLRSLLR